MGWELGYGVLECSPFVALPGGTVDDSDLLMVLPLLEDG